MPSKSKPKAKSKAKAKAAPTPRQPTGRKGRKARLLQTEPTGFPECGRTLIYTPCMKCQCPLTVFSTDLKHRFLCVRCHAYLAENRRQWARVCFCGNIEVCVTCARREYDWRSKRRRKEQIAKWSKEYHQWRREHLKQLEAKKNGRAKAART